MFGEVLLISLTIFPFVYAIGYISEKLLLSTDFGSIGNTIINLIFFVGVIVHEVSHRLMDLLVGVPSHNLRVKYRDENSSKASPHGSVTPLHPYQMTLLQGFLTSFAPLIFGTWIIYFLLKVVFNPIFDPIARIIVGICIVSIFITLSPSRGDLFFLKFSYQNDPQHGQYQIFLVILSFLISWLLVGSFNIIFSYEFFYYFIIIFCYIILKYSFISLGILINKIRYRKGRIPSKIRRRRLIRRRFKPEMVERYYMDYEE